MIKKITILAIGIALGLTGIVAVAAKKPQAPQMPPTVVKLMTAQQKIWQESIQETGSLSAYDGVMLSAEVPGRITKIYFKSGQYVKQGDPLVEIFPDVIKAELAGAQAQLLKSQLDYARDLKLYKKGFVTKAEIDRYRAILDSAQAQVDNFTAQLNQHLIKAPFSGNIGLRQVSLGDYVNPGHDLVSLQSVDPIRVDFSVPQKYISGIKVGDKVTITSQAFDKAYTGTIYAFDANVDPNTRMLGMRAKVANPNHILVPDTFVVVNLNITHAQPVVVIPQTAVVYHEGSNYIFIAKNNKAVKTNITLGPIIKDKLIIVTKGLKPGDQVIIEGQMKLFDGYPIVTTQQYKQMVAAKTQATSKK